MATESTPPDHPELFDDFAEGPQRGRQRRKPVGVVQHVNVKLSYDHIIWGTIGLILILAVIYAVGIERGRRARLAAASATQIAAAPVQPAPAPKTAAAASPQLAPPKAQAAPVVTPPVTPAVRSATTGSASRPAQTASKKQYAIQLATYSQRPTAEREVKRLRDQGQAPFLIGRDGYSVLYVGAYPTAQEAKTALGPFRKRYPDCFVTVVK